MAHIEEQRLRAYVASRLSPCEEREIMAHIAGCDRCASRFASLLLESNAVSPPPDLQEEILQGTVRGSLSGHFLAVKAFFGRGEQRQREFFAYTARVVFAMALSLLMLVTMSGSLGKEQARPMAEFATEYQREPGKGSVAELLQKASGKLGDVLEGFLDSLSGKEERGVRDGKQHRNEVDYGA